MAQSPAPASSPDTPPQVREFLELLDDPAVRDWLETQRTANQAPTTAALSEKARIEGYFGARIEAIQQHFASLAATFPMLPADFEQAAATLAADLHERGLIEILLLLGGFVALGFGAEWLFWRMTVAARKRISELNLATVGDRLRAVATRLAFNTGLVAAFALGSVGAFLLFHWPPLLKEIVLGYLFAFLAVRLALVMGRVLLAPGGRYDHDVERFRIIPMSTRAARFWYQRLGLLVGWFAFGWVTLVLLSVLGFSLDARHLVAYMLGLGLLGIGLEMVWRRPRAALGEVQPAPGRRRLGRPRPQPAALGLLSVAMGALGGGRHAGLLARRLGRGPARRDQRDPALGQSHPATARRGCRYRAAERARGLPRARLARRADHRRRPFAGPRLASRSGRSHRQRHAVHPSHARSRERDRDRAARRLRVACHEDRDRSQARGGAEPGRTEYRGREAPCSGAHLAADPAQRPVRHPARHGGDDGSLGARRGDRAADRRRGRGRRRHRLRGADGGQGHHQRNVLSARRRFSGRRVHSERETTRARSNPSACARSSSGTNAGRSTRCRSASSARFRT